MNHEYTPRYFLRQVPMATLKDYFGRRNELAGLKWDGDNEQVRVAVYDAWHALPAESIRRIESEFRAIYELATEDGVRIMVEEAAIFAPDMLDGLHARAGFLDKALWLFLNNPDLFAHVSRCDHADQLSRSWKTRNGLPKKEPDVVETAIDALAAEIGQFYWDKEGRGGHNCRAEHFKRANARTYFFVYPEDYADTFIGYDKNGTFVRMPQQPAFEIVFAFDAVKGVLDLYAKGDKHVKQRLEEIFGKCILGADIGPEAQGNPPHNLNGLKDRSFPMPTDPQDNIRQVRVKSLKLYLPDGMGHITLDTPAKAPSADTLYDNMDAYLVGHQISRDAVRVVSATIQMVIGAIGNGREKKIEFNVSARSARGVCRDHPDDHLARKYLQKWGILSA